MNALVHRVVFGVLILASASATRAQMLTAAGVAHRVEPPRIDETAVKAELGEPRQVALELARRKALAISNQWPADWVIGGDSVVEVEGQRFDKPASRSQAAEHLAAFSGREMLLSSAVALARDGELEWNLVDTARLKVRPLSAGFIATYLDWEWPAVGQCVGVFRMEGTGAQLFEAIEGSHFTVLGMPLLPLLAALRDRSLLPS